MVFCLSDFIIISKSEVDTISEPNLATYHKRISSTDSPDSKSSSF